MADRPNMDSLPSFRTWKREQLNKHSVSTFLNDVDRQASALDHGILTIESILAPGSASNEGLTEKQREGLKKLRSVLILGVDNETFIPQSLLDEREANQFVLSEYAGLQQARPKRKLRAVVKASMFVRKLQFEAASSRSMQCVSQEFGKEIYVPQAWLSLREETQHRVRDMLTWESLSKWGFNIFELAEIAGGNALVLAGWAILASPYSQKVMDSTCGIKAEDDDRPGYNFMETFNLDHEVLCNFLIKVQAEYTNVPYHNSNHAADVVQTLHALLQMGAKDFASEPLELFALLLSAVVHDMGHPGVNNAYQINAKTDLALIYNDISVLENFSAARTFKLLMGKDKDESINIFSGFKNNQKLSIRKLVIEAVLHTDMTKHFSMVSKLKGLLILKDESPMSFNWTEKQKWEILGFILHVADISNPCKPDPLFKEWADLCLEEFFRQGDLEKKNFLPMSPLCNRNTTTRPDSQIGFIKFVILPTFAQVGKLLPEVEEKIMPQITQNLNFWLTEKENEEEKGKRDLPKVNEDRIAEGDPENTDKEIKKNEATKDEGNVATKNEEKVCQSKKGKGGSPWPRFQKEKNSSKKNLQNDREPSASSLDSNAVGNNDSTKKEGKVTNEKKAEKSGHNGNKKGVALGSRLKLKLKSPLAQKKYLKK